MGRLITRLKKVFQNKLHSSADQNLSFKTSYKVGFISLQAGGGGGGSYNGVYFFLRVDEPINGGAYMYVLRFGHHFDYPFVKNLCIILGFMIQLYFIAREKLDKEFAACELFYGA